MRPVDIQPIGDELALKWDDGSEGFIPLEKLRRACPCASCSGEPDLFGRMYAGPRPVYRPESFQIAKIDRVGNYALQPLWGDGHHTGYHTYMLLRDRCPCDVCTRERATRHETHASSPASPATGAGDRHWHGGDR